MSKAFIQYLHTLVWDSLHRETSGIYIPHWLCNGIPGQSVESKISNRWSVHLSSLAKWTSNLRSETKNPVYQFETYNSRLTLNISDSLFSTSTALLSDAYLMLRCSFRRCKVRSGDRNDVISIWIVLGTSVYPVSRRRWAIVM